MAGCTVPNDAGNHEAQGQLENWQREDFLSQSG
jgi:hypothetical protein